MTSFTNLPKGLYYVDAMGPYHKAPKENLKLKGKMQMHISNSSSMKFVMLMENYSFYEKLLFLKVVFHKRAKFH